MSENVMRTGGDDFVEVLEELGVDTVFGVVSVHNLPLVDAVERRLRFVPVRHEQAAVNAADGFGRARQHLGVALTSTGTGAGNAAGALVESASAGSALLHVTGQIESRYLGSGRGVIHEVRDQFGMLDAISKSAISVDPSTDARQGLQQACSVALAAPRGPVSVEWPIDLQYAAAPQTTEGGPRAAARHDTVAGTDEIARAVELLRGAKRPVVWAGGGAVGAREQVDRLLAVLGAGLLTSNAGRGTIPEDDPRCIGNFAASTACASLLADADVLLSIGTHFRSNETRSYRLQLPRPHVQIDIDPAALGRVHDADVGLEGDASAVLDLVLASLGDGGSTDPGWAGAVAATRREVRDALAADIGPQDAIRRGMREVLDRDSVIARDVTVPSSAWGNRLLPIYEPWTNIYPRGGGIAQGLAMGIGASLARPSAPTAVMIGDGGLVGQLGELATLAQERPWCVVIVFNDRGYGVLRNMQDRYIGRRSGVDLTTPDFGQLAGSFGLAHDLVEDADDFADVMQEAVERGEPSVIEVDVFAIGEMPRPFTPPVDVPEPSVVAS